MYWRDCGDDFPRRTHEIRCELRPRGCFAAYTGITFLWVCGRVGLSFSRQDFSRGVRPGSCSFFIYSLTSVLQESQSLSQSRVRFPRKAADHGTDQCQWTSPFCDPIGYVVSTRCLPHVLRTAHLQRFLFTLPPNVWLFGFCTHSSFIIV